MSVELRYSGRVPYRHPLTHLLAQSGNWLFLALVFILPFHRVPFFNANLFDIKGFKPFNLLSAVVLAYLVFQNAPLSATDKIEQRSIRVFLLYLATFIIVFSRSIPNAPLFHSRVAHDFPESYLEYVLSYGVVSSFYMLPFLFVLKRCCSFSELERVASAICLSILLLSAAFIMAALMNPSAAFSGSRVSVNELCEAYFGVHYNTMGTIYICTAPLLLYKVLTRNALWIVPVALSLFAILLLTSRSALLTVAVSYFLFLLHKRKFIILILGAAMAGIMSFLWIGPSMEAVLTVGLQGTRDDVSANSLLTGRLEHIWIPLLSEWTSNIGLLLFGAGRYGIITSESWYTGTLIPANHAHNAIIDFFLDCGAIASSVLLIFIYIGVSTAWRVGRRLNHDLYWASSTCIFGYGISMLTEREVFPTIDNMYLFLLIAMMINLARLSLRARPSGMRTADYHGLC
jgi:hypothetical protein